MPGAVWRARSALRPSCRQSFACLKVWQKQSPVFVSVAESKDTATPKWYSFCQNLARHPSPRIKRAYQSPMRLFAELGLVTFKTA